MTVFLLLSSTHQAFGDSVVTTIPTQINYNANGKVTSFVTRENTLENALADQGIKLQKNDITNPPLTTTLVGQKVNAILVPATPVLINDNGQSWTGKSAYTDTENIFKQLAVTVDPADIVVKELILDPVTENAVGQEITIKRAPVYTIAVDDHEVIVHSWKQQVSDILAEGKVSLNQNDTVSPSSDAVAPATGQIEVTRVNYADVDQTVTIPYQTSSQTSYDLYKGQSKVIQEGVNGSKTQTLHIVYHNGAEVSRDVTSESVTASAQTKIVAVGVKPYTAGQWWDTLVAAGKQYGVDPLALYNVMLCESGGNPYAGGYYKGLFQYSPDTWAGASQAAGYGGRAITDGTAQIYVTAWKVSKSGWSAWGCKP